MVKESAQDILQGRLRMGRMTAGQSPLTHELSCRRIQEVHVYPEAAWKHCRPSACDGNIALWMGTGKTWSLCRKTRMPLCSRPRENTVTWNGSLRAKLARRHEAPSSDSSPHRWPCPSPSRFPLQFNSLQVSTADVLWEEYAVTSRDCQGNCPRRGWLERWGWEGVTIRPLARALGL